MCVDLIQCLLAGENKRPISSVFLKTFSLLAIHKFGLIFIPKVIL